MRTATFKFLGAQSYGANFSLDGQRPTAAFSAAPTESKPSLEAVGEINVLSNDFSAEYRDREYPSHHQARRGGLPRFGFLQQQEFGVGGMDRSQDIIGKQEFAPIARVRASIPTPYFNFNDVGGSFGGPIPGLEEDLVFLAL